MTPLEHELYQLENYLHVIEKTNPKISNSTIGWQLEHCLLVINGIVNQLEISKPENYKRKWSIPKWIVFTTGKIPRGKAKAPKIVSPTKFSTVYELIDKIEFTKENVTKMSSFSENLYFTHPIFGDLNKKETIKFLTIHTKHHLKIMNDILKK